MDRFTDEEILWFQCHPGTRAAASAVGQLCEEVLELRALYSNRKTLPPPIPSEQIREAKALAPDWFRWFK